jgi:hypothetical protein
VCSAGDESQGLTCARQVLQAPLSGPFFEIGSYYIAQAGLNSLSSCLSLPRVGITVVHNYVRLHYPDSYLDSNCPSCLTFSTTAVLMGGLLYSAQRMTSSSQLACSIKLNGRKLTLKNTKYVIIIIIIIIINATLGCSWII